MIDFVRTYIAPGSITFLLVAMAVGIALLFTGQRRARWGRRWLATLFIAYWLMSIRLGAGCLVALLTWGIHPVTAAEAASAQAIVVLDGGTARTRVGEIEVAQATANTLLRAIEAVRVHRLNPALPVFVTGGDYKQPAGRVEADALREAVIDAGVPADKVTLDSSSPSTHESARTLERLLRERGRSRIVLVTAPTHLRRATSTFRARGFDVLPSPAPPWADVKSGWLAANLWPTSGALEASSAALYEFAGLTYYFARGWLA